MKVSIVLPTYNRAYIVGHAIESVLRQTYTDWELIIVDDGSTDTTHEVVKRFDDQRIRYIKHEMNRGLAASRNTGIKNARGAYIANLDSDDIWLPQKLEKELAAFKNTPPNVYVVYSGYERTLGNGRIARLPEAPGERNGDLRRLFLEVNLISMQMALVKKELFDIVGLFDEAVPTLQDWEFWIRASKKTNFLFIPEMLTRGVVLKDSLANNKKKRLQAREMIFKKHEREFEKYPKIFARHAFSIGNAFALRGDMKKAKRYLTDARASDPKSKYIVASILASFGSARLYNLVARRS